MFVQQLSSDLWAGGKCSDIVIGNPTWQEINAAILELDARSRTVIGLTNYQGSDHYMLIAGPWKERYLVNATKDNYHFFSLVDPKGSRCKVLCFIGGQYGDYEERYFVPRAWAIEAAEHFVETGELKSTLPWSSDY